MIQTALTALERPAQPFYPNRVMNFLGRFKRPIVADPAELMESASAATGLRDFGSEDFLPALEIFCRALNQDREMSYIGCLSARRFNTKLLIDRLQIQNTLEEIPEIQQQEVRRPVMICGNPRSGTTLLQRLLAQDPQFRTTLAWESYFATSPPHPDAYEDNPSIRQAEEFLAMLDSTSPALFIAHPMEVRLPEECWMLLERQCIRPLFSLFWEVPEYWEWFCARSEDDLANDLLYYKKQLQVLQWHFTNRRWLLKSPIHALLVSPHSRVFPDMTFIQCHRDPVRALPSLCSLVASRKVAYYAFSDFRALGRKGLSFFYTGCDRILKARKDLDRERFLDVSFNRLLEDPIGSVEELYHSLGLEMTLESKNRMVAFLDSQRDGKHTKHRYSLEEFGLDEADVCNRLEGYREQFQDFF